MLCLLCSAYHMQLSLRFFGLGCLLCIVWALISIHLLLFQVTSSAFSTKLMPLSVNKTLLSWKGTLLSLVKVPLLRIVALLSVAGRAVAIVESQPAIQ